MPHFRLMDPEALGPEMAALQRARLHVRGGNRRLSQGKVSAGLVTLYDALTSALDWYYSSPERRSRIGAGSADLREDLARYDALVKAGILDGAFDLKAFDLLIARALEEELVGLDYSEIQSGLLSVLIQLGVLPFDELALLPEDPRTF